MKLAIFGNNYKGFEEYIYLLFKELESHDSDVLIYQPFYENILNECNFKPQIEGTFTDYHDISRDCDFMISMGGDGTFLKAVSIIRDIGIPIIGINIGRLGFLANISKNEISQAIASIYNKKYSLEERTLLKVEGSKEVFGDFNCALNEITFQRIDATMITIHVSIDGEYLNTYWADGLIISTPTGSTAYSLSAGGPVVVPQSNNFVILPLAPHNVTVRPLVVSDIRELKIAVDTRSSQFLATLDSRSHVLPTEKEVIVKPASFKVKMLRLQSNSFYKTLRNKLMWGMDKRN